MSVWRIRIKNQGDYSDQAWKTNRVGIWYGAWNAREFEQAVRKFGEDADAIASHLNELPKQKKIDWEVSRTFVKAALRFRNIGEDDWLLVYFDGKLGLAQVESSMESAPNDELNVRGEIFKYRKITKKKLFCLADLPDAYRLVPSQGRSTIHSFNGMKRHVELLAKCNSAQELRQRMHDLPFPELLDFLGASAWESFCLAYLIFEEDYVPTGLSTGRTLPIVDIVGRRRRDGRRIIAQCKKSNEPVSISDEFINVLGGQDVAYYFAYGGCLNPSPRVRVISRENAQTWVETENGRTYRELLLSS